MEQNKSEDIPISDYEGYGGGLLLIALITLSILGMISNVSLVHYIMVVTGLFSTAFLAYRVKQTQDDLNSPLSYTFIVIGGVISSISILDTSGIGLSLGLSGVVAGAVLVVLGIVFRLFLIELILRDLFNALVKGVRRMLELFSKEPLGVALLVFQLSALILTGIPLPYSMEISLVLAIGGLILHLYRNRIDYYTMFAITFSIFLLFVYFMSYLLDGISVYYLFADVIVIIGLTIPQSFWGWFYKKTVSTIRNMLHTILDLARYYKFYTGLFALVFYVLMAIEPANVFPNSRRIYFLLGSLMTAITFSDAFFPVVESIADLISSIVTTIVGSIGVYSIYLAASILVFLWAITGIGITDLPFALTFRLVFLPVIGFYLLFMTNRTFRTQTRRYYSSFRKNPSNALVFSSLVISYLNLSFILMVNLQLFRTIQLVAFIIFLGAFRPLRRLVRNFGIWVTNNTLLFAKVILSIGLMVFGIIVLASESTAVSLLGDAVTGVTRLIVGIALITTGVLLNRENIDVRRKR